ncbi:MAG TPA: gliding motility protein GldC [Gammaproteobacteria bacterium]|jgi:gliding motility-associated protein GldC
MSRTAEIKLTVDLDADDVPTQIMWEASEARDRGPTPCQSMMLSLWDSERKAIAAIDLWAKDTTIDDMNLFVYQVIHHMAETYLRATKNEELAELIHEFGEAFGGTTGLINLGADNSAGRERKLVNLISLARDSRQRSAE